MSKADEIKKEVRKLTIEGSDLQLSNRKNADLGALATDYERWFTKAYLVVKQLAPERAADFRDAYNLDKRKEINFQTYTVSDYLTGLVVTRAGTPTFNTDAAYSAKIVRQLTILLAAAETAESVLRDIRTELRSELIDKDIEAAKELFKANHLRSAGVVCGVVLETHLKLVANRHGITIAKNNPQFLI